MILLLACRELQQALLGGEVDLVKVMAFDKCHTAEIAQKRERLERLKEAQSALVRAQSKRLEAPTISE